MKTKVLYNIYLLYNMFRTKKYMKIYLLKCIGISMNKAPTLTSLCFIGLKSQLLRRWSNIPLLQYFLLSTNAISLSPPYLGAWCLRSYSKGNNVCGIGEGRAVRSLACDVCGEVICHYNACGCHGELLLISSNCSFFQAGNRIHSWKATTGHTSLNFLVFL